jgi:hypothetical protein
LKRTGDRESQHGRYEEVIWQAKERTPPDRQWRLIEH